MGAKTTLDVDVNLNTDEIDEAIEKTNLLLELLREASSLASSLAGNDYKPSFF